MAKAVLENRWCIALAGTALQLCLGSVYAWSYFQKPLVEAYGWSNTQATWTFSLAICCLGLAAAWGGLQLPRMGPRRLAMIGGVLTQVNNPWLFGGLICYILLCYGGGFGTMPSFVLNVFGAIQMPVVYGAILTAWSAGGIIGPQFVAFINDHHATQLAQYVFLGNIAVLSLGFVLSSTLRDGHQATSRFTCIK